MHEKQSRRKYGRQRKLRSSSLAAEGHAPSESPQPEFRASEELASWIRTGILSFCEFFKEDQFEKMAAFYTPDATLMLPRRETIRGREEIIALFGELKKAGLHDW